ncbi:MAG: cyclic nucleotide-binding domain-containing protein [Anaerolineae bacterium]|jgi:hypothetical protein|nr:cyclic nucleotide-binding domain-containing protein [Anaerolineae bacterium]MBT7070271.1 cyclic nucleotide-binding domain-containing protein [Anaerolineae bacterium]MBT7324279.1 cyclic nucleotide-binding domain-containing protein [Anaerolineae bacterium]
MLSVEAIAAFIEKIHLFIGLDEDGLFNIAEHFEEKSFGKDDLILNAVEQSENFYIIYSGKVEIVQEEKGQKSAVFVAGDYFGEEALLQDEKSHAEVKAKTEAILLVLPASFIGQDSAQIEFLRERLDVFITCRSLSKTLHFDWVNENEVIYFLVRKHQILFWRRLPLPVTLLLGGPATAFWGMWVGAIIPLIAGVLAFLAGLVWLAWDWLDWQNDYYIVTSQRVIWLEKVIGLYDSRQEAYMSEITSVSVETDAIVQSFFDYGHVNVRTIFGGIDLKYISCPQQAHQLIEELWQRSKSEEKQKAKDKLHQAIKDQIEASKEIVEKKRMPPSLAETQPQEPLPSRILEKKKKKQSHLFTLRFQEGRDITYRKHIVILIRNAGIPAMITLFSFGYIAYQLYQIFLLQSDTARSISFIALLAVASILSFGWTIYQYVDWTNDIFKVTRDKIYDIDRKPFGEVQSRSAPLENIESTEYKRRGLLSVFFNYGTVYVHIGAEEFEFENVLDPASVQQDINRRYMTEHEKKKEAQAKKERDDMIKWLVAYHESTDQFDEMMLRLKEQEEAEEGGEAKG